MPRSDHLTKKCRHTVHRAQDRYRARVHTDRTSNSDRAHCERARHECCEVCFSEPEKGHHHGDPKAGPWGAALAILGGRESIDVLLIDVIMPEVQGPEVARLALAKCPELRIVFMTGYVAEAGEAINRQHVLSKPFTVTELAHKVQEVLRAPEAPNLENVIPIRRKPGVG